MRRLMCISAFALLLAVPAWAQHGGGHGGGGGHASFGGGHAGGGSGARAATGGGHFSGGGVHTASGARSGFSRGPYLHDGYRGRIATYGFRNNCYGYSCRGYGYYPWWGAGWDPWWYDSGSSYDNSYQQNVAQAAEMNRENLEEQQMLRQEEADGDQDAYARNDPPQRRVASGDDKPGTAFMPGTVLVFRDQHKEEIQNYAIVGQTLWNFSPQHTQKISLAQLDLAATAKANDDRGVTFRLPGPNLPGTNQAQ